MKRLKILFAVIVAYVVMQFAWWAFYLAQLRGNIRTLEMSLAEDVGQREIIERTYHSKLLMIAGEGFVFLLILLTGIWFVYRGLKREEADIRLRNNFLLSVSHELKTPIAVVKLFQQTFIKRPSESELLRPMASAALQETQRLEDLVEKILFAAALEGTSDFALNTTFQVGELVRSVGQEYVFQIESGRLSVIVTGEAMVSGNESHLRFALRNLLDNAFKYAPDGTVELCLSVLGDRAIITVKDSGPGISAEDQKHIFEKFFRSGDEMVRQTKGTGLGLYLTKAIADMHRAKLSVLSFPGKGTTFVLELKMAGK